MGTGIIVCGLNGCGKSTLGKALAEKLKFHFIDNENLFFSKTDSDYAFPRSRKEAKKLLINEVSTHEKFVFAVTKGNYSEEILPFFQYAVLMDVPKDIRLQRGRNRSYQKFGNRILPGGDLHDQEEKFFDMVSSRAEHCVTKWVYSLNCPIIRVDGTKSIEENINFIIEQIQI